MKRMMMAAAVLAVAAFVAFGADLTEVSSYVVPTLVSQINTTIGEADTRLDAVEAAGVGGTLAPAYVIVGNASTVATAVAVSGDVTITTAGAVAIGANKVTEAMLKAVDTTADEDFLSYESTTGDFEWHSAAEIAGKFATVGTLSTNVIVDASYTNTIVLRTLASGVLVVSSWTKNAVP